MRTPLRCAAFICVALVSGPVTADEKDPSLSPMRSAIERYGEDRGALSRTNSLQLSPARHERLSAFYKDALKSLEQADFDALDTAGRVDYLLLRNELRYELKRLDHRKRELDEAAALLPFAQPIVELEQARRRVEDVDPKKSAESLTAICRQVAEVRKSLEARLKQKEGAEQTTATPSPVLANRAASLVDSLRDTLKSWHGFYAGYDPDFTWWTRQPYPKADKELEEYARFLRTKLAGYGEKPDDDEPVIGDPIGRQALLDALEAELIPYTPEELIEIANREFAWCEKEMKRAADDLGFSGDWKKALDHVSAKHVPPGEQPRLIKQLAEEATKFVEDRNLVTVPPLCKETWRMEMMSVERQRVNPYFTGGEVISVSYPTDTMAHEDKLMSLRGNNPSFSRATVHHELIPGHHLQGFMAQRYNAHRRTFRTPFLIEGWALYWEMLLWDLGFPRSAEDRVGMLFWRSHRCARIIFSLKFHLGQMTAKEAIDLLTDRVGHERRNATAEVRRSVAGNYGPLYQAAYMLGGLQIRAMRKELVESGRMTDKQFHDAILRENSIPISLIRASLTGQKLTRDFKGDWRFYGDVTGPAQANAKDAGSQPRADARARSPAPSREPRVYRDRVEPNWIEATSRFWYRNALPGGKQEFVLVDAEKGTRDPTFDPVAAGLKVEGDRLPAEKTPRPSGRNGPDTEITFVNDTDGDVQIFWSDPAGNRQPFGSVGPGERRAQHTYAGHVWVAVGRDGSVLAVFEAADDPALAVIDGKGGSDEARQRQRGRRRRGNRGDGRPDMRRPSDRSPDGKWQVFARDHDLWLRDLTSKEEHRLSRDGSAADTYGRDRYRDRAVELAGERDATPSAPPEVFWSPDSKRLVAMRTHVVPGRTVYLIESSPRDQVQPRLQSYPYLKPGDELPVQTPRLFDVTERRAVPIQPADLWPNPWDVGRIRWSDDSSRFTLLYNQRGHQLLRLIEVDGASGAARVTVEEKSPTFIDYSGKFFCELLDATREVVWMSERDGWNHLYLHDANTGAVKNHITRGQWVVRGVERVDAEKRQVWFRAGGVNPGEDPYHVHLCRVNFDGTGFTILTRGDGDHSFEFSPDRKYFLDTWSRVDKPPVTELRRGEDGSLVCTLEEADVSEWTGAGGRFPQRFVAKGRDGGTDIYGIIHRPRDFDPSRRYPVVESIYAGPQSAHVPKSFRARHGQQRLADRGFIVVQIDGMGTSWRSKRFHDVCWKNLADAGLPDRIAWMKAAAAKHSELDLSRVGVYGGSAGGQNALGALLFHGDFYDAAVADCGCHDNRMDKVWWNEQWMGWPVGPEYAASSNVTHAHKLQGKLMLIVGELDRNVDPASTMQVVNALVRADKDFDLLVIPGAGHAAGSSPYGRRRTEEFFVRHLLGEQPNRSGVAGTASAGRQLHADPAKPSVFPEPSSQGER